MRHIRIILLILLLTLLSLPAAAQEAVSYNLNPQPGTTVQDLQTIEIIFDENVWFTANYVNSIMLYNIDTEASYHLANDPYSESANVFRLTFISQSGDEVTPRPITQPGHYTLTIKEGAFYLGDENGDFISKVSEIQATYTIDYIYNLLSSDPPNGAIVPSIQNISTYWDGPVQDHSGVGTEKVTLRNSDGIILQSAELEYDWDDWSHFTVTFEEVTEPGEYTVIFPAGIITYDGTPSSPEVILTYTIDGSLVSKDPLTLKETVPADRSTVTSLGEISLFWDANEVYTDSNHKAIITNDNGVEVTIATIELDMDDWDNLNKTLLNISPVITTEDTYKIIIPAGAVTAAEGTMENAEIVLTYTVKGEPVAGDDFEYNGINYTILDFEARTCQTTPGPNFGDEPSNSYVGDLVIPSIVSDGQYQYTVVEIGGHGFQKCETITSLTLPTSVTTIGNCAFGHCSGLKSINFPSSITHIGNDAFRYCTSLETLILPNSLTVLNSGVFADCTNLTSVTLPEELTTIHGEAFRACSSLKSLSLPASVTTIESYAFAAPLTEITFYTSKPTEAPTDIFDEDTYEIATLNMPNANLADIETISPWNRFQHIVAKDGTIDPGMYQIEFDRTEPASGATVSSLEQISTWWTLPNTINITNDPIPYVVNEDGDRLDRIEARLVLNDQDHNNILINISPEITTNGTYQVVIPAGAITDGSNPNRFTNDEVIFTYTVKRDLVAGDDFEYQGLKYTVLDTEARTCETKEGTETTPGNSFEGDLVIPEKVSDGTNEYSVTRVGIYGFKGCNNITSLTLPLSLTEIGEEAFMNCTGLTGLDLPRNITSIEGGAFDNCNGIVTVSLPEALVRIPDQCFNNCTNLTTISFPESLKEIGNDAFLECNKLANITLPNSLSIIESGAFNGCAVSSLTLPASIANIMSLAFHGCPVKIVNYEASKPVEAPSNIFDDAVYEDATLIMPNATLADIQATTPWNKFVHIEAKDNKGSGNNMVVNGDFENPDYVQSVPSEYTYSPVDTWENLSELPGWELSINSVWNGVISLVTEKDEIGKDLIRPVNGTNILLFRGYVDNGWTTISASQIVKGLVPGREYNLDFLIAENQGIGAEWTPNPNYGFIISEVNDGTEGKWIIDHTYTEQNPKLTYQAYKFIAPNDGRVYIRFFLMNDYYDGNYKDDFWMALDNVRIYDGEPNPPTGPVAGDKFTYQGIVYIVLDAENRTCIAHAPDYEGEVPTVKDSNTIIPETVSDGTYDYTVTEIREFAFTGVENLLSVTLPSSIESIGENAFTNCPRLTSLVWKAHRRMQEDVVPSIDNPNLLVYVDSLKFAPVELNHNIVVMDTESGSPECQRLVIEPAYPFTPLHSFISLNSSMTKEFSQTTPLGGCAGWETIVLPFDATSVAVSDARGELTPFAQITNIETQYPYWLYEADSAGEWKEAFGIQASIPYLISMPNNEQYAVRYRISGPVTFSNPNAVTITPQTTAPYSVTWASGHQFRSLWLPLTTDEARDAMGLNVGIDNLTNDEGETLLPGSAFHINVKPLPLEAYVTRYGARRALPVRGGQSHAALLEADNALSVIAKGGTIYLSGSYDRIINIFRIDGVCVKSLDMKAGETCKVEGLAKGVYIVAGHKVIMK